tara:strand:- start:82 stop:1509 length:1428 start_codon:yes stop_codon:yes gene_type:complete
MSETSLAESAQVIFCSIADGLSPTQLDKVLNTDKERGYPTFVDFERRFKKEIDNALKYIDVDEEYKDIANFLNKKTLWYISSVAIGKKVVKDLRKDVDPNFTILKKGYQSKGFNWFRGDGLVFDTIAQLYKIANKATSTQTSMWGGGNSSSTFYGFGDINKWNPADIYYANDTAKKALKAELIRAEKLGKLYGFTGGKLPKFKSSSNTDSELMKPKPGDGLNVFIARLIDGGHLLPLSLKKSGTSVVLKPVNFSEDTKRNLLDSIEFTKHLGWKPYKRLDKKKPDGKYDPVSFRNSWSKFSKGEKTSTRDIRLMFKGESGSGEIKVRHDPSVKRIVAEIIYGGAKAKAGSIASYKQFADIWRSVDQKAGDNFFKKYEAGDKIFKEEKKKIEKQKDALRKVKMPTNSKVSEYDHYVAIVSAENIINNIMGGSLGLKAFFDPTNNEEQKSKQTLFVRLLYQVASSRSDLSSRFVIAK